MRLTSHLRLRQCASGMSSDTTNDAAHDILDSWKAIADHLNRDVRTVQRWEKREALPVHRHAGSIRAVFAYRAEVDRWWAAKRGELEPQPVHVSGSASPHGITWWLVLAAGGGALISMFAWGGSWLGRDSGALRPARSKAPETAPAALLPAVEAYNAATSLETFREAAALAEPLLRDAATAAAAQAIMAKAYVRASFRRNAQGEDPLARAADHVRSALELAPESTDAQLALALLHRERREIYRARVIVQRLLHRDPNSAEAYAILADSYSALINMGCEADRNPDLADEYYRRAITLNPRFVAAINNWAVNLRYLGQPERCVREIDRFLERSQPSSPTMLNTRAACLLVANRVDEAEQTLAPLQEQPTRSSFYRGWLLLKRGENDAAIAEIDSAMAAATPGSAELTAALVYLDSGAPARAQSLLAQAFEREPACTTFVARSIAFAPYRHYPELRSVLAKWGVK
jgi:tetratricopeptide (TPR) repeat protein